MRQRSKNYKRTIIFLLVLLCLPYIFSMAEYYISSAISHHISNSLREMGAIFGPWEPLPPLLHVISRIGSLIGPLGMVVNFVTPFLALSELLINL